MGQPVSKIESAHSREPELSRLLMPGNSDHRIAASRIRTLPPPPPLAALAKHAPENEQRATSTPTVSVPLPPLPEAAPLPLEERFTLDLAPNPLFAAALSQPPRRRSMPWLRIGAAAISALALLTIGYLAATLRMQAPQPAAQAAVPARAANTTATSPQRAVLAPGAASPSAAPAIAAAQSPTLFASSNADHASIPTDEQPQAATGEGARHTADAVQATTGEGAHPADAVDAVQAAREPEPSDSGRSSARMAVIAKPHVTQPRATDSMQPTPSPVASDYERTTSHVPTQLAPMPAAPQPTENPTPAPRQAAEALAPMIVLPVQPTREQVQQSLQLLQPALLACAAGGHGVSVANVTVASSGRVSHGTIEGVFAGTPEGSCMARALRTATFPAFSAQNFSVKYPFRL
jgi:hypothetical protein